MHLKIAYYINAEYIKWTERLPKHHFNYNKQLGIATLSAVNL